MTTAARQVRGSGLLSAGRLFAILINLAVQILTVRYLSQSDYGAFAYALSLAAVVETIATLGLDRTVSRYVPMYHEQDDVPRLYGTLLTIGTTIVAVGAAAVVVLIAGSSLVMGGAPDDETLRALVVVLAALGPVQAIDHLFENLLASFGQPKAIVVRRHVLGPLLKLAAVVLVVTMDGDVELLGALYLAAGVLGIGLYLPLLVRTLRESGLLARFRFGEVDPPVRELFAFALPLLAIDVALVARTAVDAIIVEAFHGTSEVALLRSVQPIARLNQLVFASFAILYTPMASRLFTRGRGGELNDLYWQSAVWQALVSFPIVASTLILAPELIGLLFGERYLPAAPVLALLAIGYYANAATGQNSLTLRVYGRVRLLVVGALLAGGITIALDFALIPRFGAVGAAIATAIGLIGHNAFNQIAMHRRTGIRAPGLRILRIYGVVLGLLVVLAGVDAVAEPGLLAGLVIIGAVSLALVAVFRSDLRLASTFPELRRLPIVGGWL